MLTSAVAETHLHRPFAVSKHRKPEASDGTTSPTILD